MIRSGDTNERVQNKAIDGIKDMLAKEKVQDSGILQDKILMPYNAKDKEPPKQALTRAELALYMIEDLNLVDSVTAFTKFGVSAVEHSSMPIRKVGEQILLALYDIDGDRVRDIMPEDNPKIRKTHIAYRKLFEEFDRKDGIDNLTKRRA